VHIFDLFAKAMLTLKQPKLVYIWDNEEKDEKVKVVLSLSSKYPASRINIYTGQVWLGRIVKDNVKRVMSCQWNDKETIDPELKNTIRALVAEPIGMCSLVGQQYAHCCFCGSELNNKNSVTVGYGPICAEKWGLPWAGTAEAVIKAKLTENL
jgi:hypothetical protein